MITTLVSITLSFIIGFITCLLFVRSIFTRATKQINSDRKAAYDLWDWKAQGLPPTQDLPSTYYRGE